jgi:hypothetical protein
MEQESAIKRRLPFHDVSGRRVSVEHSSSDAGFVIGTEIVKTHINIFDFFHVCGKLQAQLRN